MRYWEQLVGYVTIWSGSLVVEVCMIIVSLKGTVADDKPREPMQILIYIKQGTLIYFQPSGNSLFFAILCPGFLSIELVWVCGSFSWLINYFPFSDLCTLQNYHKSVMVGLVISNMVVLAILVIFTWCAWDRAGRDWLKLKNYEQSAQLYSGRMDR